MMMFKQSVMMVAIAALGIASIQCGARSSLLSSQGGAGDGGATPSSSGTTTPDAGVWTPKSLAGLVLWLDGTIGVQTSGEALAIWEDQSGLKNDATPSGTGSGPPVLVANAIGMAPAVRFDGTNFLVVQDDDSLQFGTGDFLVAVVMRHTTPTDVGWGYGLVYSKQAIPAPYAGPALVANTEEGTTQVAAQVVYHQAIIDTSQSGLNGGQPMVLVMRRQGSPGLATLEIRLNGASSAVTMGSVFAADVSAPQNPVHIGGTPAMQDVVGDIAEVIALHGATPDADVAALEGYLETKYGL